MYLLTDNVIQVWNADIGFDQRDLIHLLWKGPLLYVILDAHIVVRRRAALRNKHLPWEEKCGQIQTGVVGVTMDTNVSQSFLMRSNPLIGTSPSWLMEELHRPGVSSCCSSNQNGHRRTGVCRDRNDLVSEEIKTG